MHDSRRSKIKQCLSVVLKMMKSREPNILIIQEFKLEHFVIYQRWFQDLSLMTALGGIDQDWLDCILNDKNIQTVVAYLHGKMVAVACIHVPLPGHDMYHLMSLAIHPQHRGQGIATVLLKQLLSSAEFKQTQCWTAIVDQQNKGALQFFARMGWSMADQANTEDYIKIQIDLD